MFVPVWVIGSRMIIFPNGRGGVLASVSPEPAGDCSDVCCLFRVQAIGKRGGRVWPWPCGSCCCAAGRAPGTKRLIVITNGFNGCFLHLSGGLGFKRSLKLYSDLGLKGGFLLNRLVRLFLTTLRHAFGQLVPNGCKFVRASVPWAKVMSFATVNFRGRKFACRTTMYERRGLSTNKAWLNACQVEYTGSTLRIRWDAQSCLSQCTKISDLSTKFRPWMCTALRSFLNLLVSTRKQHKNWLEIVWSNQNW